MSNPEPDRDEPKLLGDFLGIVVVMQLVFGIQGLDALVTGKPRVAVLAVLFFAGLLTVLYCLRLREDLLEKGQNPWWCLLGTLSLIGGVVVGRLPDLTKANARGFEVIEKTPLGAKGNRHE